MSEQNSLQLAFEGLKLKDQAIICERVSQTPKLAAEYVRAAEELGSAAAHCPLAPATAHTAAKLAATAEKLAGAAADSAQSIARATTLYKRAAAKLQEAAALLPDSHTRKIALEQHASEISVRVIYLESLSGAPAAIPVEDHIGELSLDGLDGVVDERTALQAACAAEAQAPSPPADLQPSVAGGTVVTPAAAPASPWNEGAAGEKTDFLQKAVELEGKGRDLEEQGRLGEALQLYKDSLSLFSYVHKRDPRMHNPNVKKMIRDRMEELLSHAEAVKAKQILGYQAL